MIPVFSHFFFDIMLMYYDARVGTAMNGLFDIISFEPAKTYYPYLAFHQMTAIGETVRVDCDNPSIYTLAVSNGKDTEILLTYYEENDESPDIDATLHLTVDTQCEIRFFLTDGKRDNAQVHTVTVFPGEQSIKLPLKLFDIYHIVVIPRS